MVRRALYTLSAIADEGRIRLAPVMDTNGPGIRGALVLRRSSADDVARTAPMVLSRHTRMNPFEGTSIYAEGPYDRIPRLVSSI